MIDGISLIKIEILLNQEGVDIFAIKTNQKYKYGDFTLEEVTESDEKYIREVLDDNNINVINGFYY